MLDELALIEFLLGVEADGNRETRQNTAMGFLFAKQKTLHVLTLLISCYIVLAVTSGLRGGYEHWHRRRRIFLSRSVLTHGPYSLCKDVPSSLRKNSGEDFHS